MKTQRRAGKKAPIDFETRLGDWGPRGSVQAQVDGRTALIERGIPGELVRAMVRRGRKPWRGTVDGVLEASPDRVSAPCTHYSQGCGGCQRQHIGYGAQLDIKRTLADRELRAAGVEARVGAVHGMTNPWRYRHTAAIALGWEAGFRPVGRRGIVEIRDCPISHPHIGRLADDLNRVLSRREIPCYHGKLWLDCTVVGTPSAPSLQVVIQGIEGLTLESHPELVEVAGHIASLRNVDSVSYRHRSGDVRPLVGDPMSTIEVAGRAMFLPAGSFFQTNLDMLALLLDRLEAAVEGRTVQEAVDMYAGVGVLGLALARRVGTMTLVELEAPAVEAARCTAEAWGLRNVRFVSSHAEKVPSEILQADLIVVDPPRSGLGAPVVAAIGGGTAPLVLYVSCAPSSLARDLSGLQGAGFAVTSIELFDFYPQTYHVESLTILER